MHEPQQRKRKRKVPTKATGSGLSWLNRTWWKGAATYRALQVHLVMYSCKHTLILGELTSGSEIAAIRFSWE